MPSFGEKLKLEREKRKITLEEISNSTKIGTRLLQAMEEDRFNELPGGIFNKGFVRAYSRCVGLDEDQAVADYLQASGFANPPSTEATSRLAGIRPDEARKNGSRENEQNVRLIEAANASTRPLPWGLFAALLLLIALALSLWSRHQREHPKAPVQVISSATGSQPAPPQSASGAAPISVAQPNVSSRGPDPNPNRDSGSPSPAPAALSAASQTAVPPSNGLSPSGSLSAAAMPGEFTVTIQTREESWVSITADGKSVGSELLPPGSERVARGRKEIIVKAGNGAGVDLRFNGRKLDTKGAFGEVKTVIFGPQGVLPNAPPSSTP